ncbi:MAG: hypothetical protein SVU88_03285 [Candidatus Nanohaloarchaea archaeon]|nr:hypothetical protein [Candidatus Nanohaloarchaea archaeon]
MHVLLRAGMALLAAAAAILTFGLVRRVAARGRQAQIDLELNADRIIHDLRMLIGGEIVLLAGFLLIAAGGAAGRHDLVTGGETAVLLFFLAPLAVMYRWRRRLA